MSKKLSKYDFHRETDIQDIFILHFLLYYMYCISYIYTHIIQKN